MKKEFETYFTKQLKFSKVTYGTKPTVAYTESLPDDMLVSSPNVDGEVEWLPKLQDEFFDWSLIESKLKFSVCNELRTYYSTYRFLSMTGKIDRCYLYFQPIMSQHELNDLILQQYIDATYFFQNTQMFILGNAVIDGVDSYFIYYDNLSSSFFCYEAETKNKYLIPFSLSKTIEVMEVIN